MFPELSFDKWVQLPGEKMGVVIATIYLELFWSLFVVHKKLLLLWLDHTFYIILVFIHLYERKGL